MNSLVLLASALLFIATDANHLVVKTTQGNLKGSLLSTWKGKTIHSFRGVRFAKPPVGELRFKAPQPLESWNGVRSAERDGFACPQPVANYTEGNYTLPTSEDCLFLNVFTNKLPENGHNPKRPVVIFFHHGAWVFNAGLSPLAGPQYLLDHDLVLVVANYRLGALGYLTTGDGVLPGNYGMKDQVAAMRWVKQNIAAFGGDPDSVTIAGCSAGGGSVLLHMVSPMSRGLFHRAISLSTAMNTLWDISPFSLMWAKKQAGLLNCSSDSSKQMADCLRTKGVDEIAFSYTNMQYWADQPLIMYTPVIEKDNGEERFLTEHPLKSFLDGNFVNVPWIAGNTKDEMNYFSYFVLQLDDIVRDLNTRSAELFPITFLYENGTERSVRATQMFKEYYLNNKPISNESEIGLGHLFSDGQLHYGHHMATKLLSKLGKEPVYSYLFEYQGRYSYRYFPGTDKPMGVVHQDDLIYLLGITARFPQFKQTDPEAQMVEKLTKLWANFIKTGNPTPEPSQLLHNVVWERLNPDKLNYLSIDSVPKMKTGLLQDRMSVWERLFPPVLNINQ